MNAGRRFRDYVSKHARFAIIVEPAKPNVFGHPISHVCEIIPYLHITLHLLLRLIPVGLRHGRTHTHANELTVHDMVASDAGNKSTRQSYVDLRGKLHTSLSL